MSLLGVVLKMLTICLISQGRAQLSDFFDSIDSIAKFEFVNFVIVDNGATESHSQTLKKWSGSHSNSVYIRREVNSTNLNHIWPEIKSHLSDWVVFPGDDDRMILEGVTEWKLIADKNESANAIAMSARILNEDGSASGEVIWPPISEIKASISPLAYSLHCPPFFWPALFIKTSTLGAKFPVSRYVLDWSISINLVMTESYLTSPISSIEYRRHSTQESNLVSLNRKMFEGVYHLDSFINSDLFLDWVTSKSEVELISFWRSVIVFPPLYGDPEMSNILLIGIARQIRATIHGPRLQNELLSTLALRLGSLMHDESMKETLEIADMQTPGLGNLRIEDEESICPIIQELILRLRGVDDALKVNISCMHDTKKHGIHINCEKYAYLPRRQALDMLVRDISLALESKGQLAFRISARERKLLLLIRKFKRYTPTSLKRRIGRI
jgi:hypothetical protein